MTEKESPRARKFQNKLAERIGKSYFVRFHMFMILSATILSGVVCSKILVLSGINSMPVRYGAAIILSYMMFFLFIKLWLLYIGVGRKIQLQTDKKGDSPWTGDVLTLPDGLSSGKENPGIFSGFGGGKSGGGGAGRSFAATTSPAEGVSETGKGSGTIADAAGGIFDIGDDSVLTLIAIVLLILIVLSIIIAGGYLIWSAPAILSDAAFHALLVAGFARKVRQAEETSWQTAIFKATWWMFIIVFVFSVSFGIIAQMVYPEAVTIKEFFIYLLEL